MRIPELTEEIELPDNVEVKVEGRTVTIKGPKGELKRTFNFPGMEIKMEKDLLTIMFKNATKKEKTMLGTAYSHINNMITGLTEGHEYRLKICSGHFPMNVSMSGDTFIIKNFLGEKVPRTLKIKQGAKVKIEGNEVTVESNNIEIAGQVAADIEQLTRITNRDIRIFQDGIYIIKKSGKEMQ
ncbi:50S ribosomal protein L6 [Candidatus Woesearchaeota archaeon]|nr:50S ribosomal protein L6 [Candidatus Woesearchaeota archaeon]